MVTRPLIPVIFSGFWNTLNASKLRFLVRAVEVDLVTVICTAVVDLEVALLRVPVSSAATGAAAEGLEEEAVVMRECVGEPLQNYHNAAVGGRQVCSIETDSQLLRIRRVLQYRPASWAEPLVLGPLRTLEDVGWCTRAHSLEIRRRPCKDLTQEQQELLWSWDQGTVD